MSAIRILTEKVASQIAAGEVVERPASVVKELIDNSIDAGARRIVTRIENGGKGLIRVTDDGVGMNRDDLLLCIERHATSKISSISDLFSIRTLGFRGEALPSISSVSRMVVTSRPADQLIGYRLKVVGGKLKSMDETGSPAGTNVEVRDLFFNVPARKKFLRAIRTETDHIIDNLSRMALPFTEMHFRLDDSEKMLLNLPGSESFSNRLAALLGRQVAASMVEADEERGEFRIRTYLASPEFSRARGDRVFVYVNKRNIRDRLLTRAVIEGYGQRLMKGRYPQAVVFLEIDPSLVDVNVHPTKQEVRFHQTRFAYEALTNIVERSLKQHFYSPFDHGYPGQFEPEESHPGGAFVAEPIRDYSGIEQGTAVFGEPFLQETFPTKDRPQIVGQLKDTYILCQVKDGLLLIDQHAAHERVVYENLKKSYEGSKIEGQSFLIPPKLDFSVKEGRVILKKIDQLAKLGLELEHFGGSTFLLRSVPSILVHVRWEDFLCELIPLLGEEAELTSESALDRMWALMACHGAIRGGQRLSQAEMTHLLDQLEGADLPTNCPHGRPVSKKFTYYEIEKMFKRVV